MTFAHWLLLGSWSLFCVALGWLTAIIMSAQRYTEATTPTPTPNPDPDPEPAKTMPEPVKLRSLPTALEVYDASKLEEPYRNRLLIFARHNRAGAFDGVDEYGDQGDSGDEHKDAC